MTVSRREFLISASLPVVALALFGCSAQDTAATSASDAESAKSNPSLLLVEKDVLVGQEPTEKVAGQSIWAMHETATSRSSLVRIDSATTKSVHAATRMHVVLEGAVEVTLADGSSTIGHGGFIQIPTGIEYSLAPIGVDAPILVGFEVPRIDFSAAPSMGRDGADSSPRVRALADIVFDVPGWDDPSDRGWTLAKSDELRVNLVEMRSELRSHLHPDADHSLVLLSGKARVVTPNEERTLSVGSYVSIPAGLAHKYFVDGSEPAMFVSFDAPAYDSSKTVYLD
ncbi:MULTISPECIES: cupin domain-containing protein [unclassified Rhodococcus (in: high G+C Gram-positive bacteria)]|uniref:cupin domain-containing protein n=1 Tax=unclassified Rhodococcus (in: high G+C Gram-positive bacteria) TaxID=192944 RepID=UPI000B9C4D0E|nr:MULTISPECIES: cupin domain-containing protein [unclassified Rhodococcus (in: high G+C Gram-positive bacteria)]OZE37617.1 hypothetical protein CH259_12295 [Rhodococcus sp. 05-2254-4]OZE40749.1 hypothetical protein CH261_27260 [Rhodococcus sp. 05-2254-3]OZE45740.1 hypothetical protein CH283_25915 [Rhodococcus sp. 05-2254-2]